MYDNTDVPTPFPHLFGHRLGSSLPAVHLVLELRHLLAVRGAVALLQDVLPDHVLHQVLQLLQTGTERQETRRRLAKRLEKLRRSRLGPIYATVLDLEEVQQEAVKKNCYYKNKNYLQKIITRNVSRYLFSFQIFKIPKNFQKHTDIDNIKPAGLACRRHRFS
jgi:hypothetical protein